MHSRAESDSEDTTGTAVVQLEVSTTVPYYIVVLTTVVLSSVE